MWEGKRKSDSWQLTAAAFPRSRRVKKEILHHPPTNQPTNSRGHTLLLFVVDDGLND